VEEIVSPQTELPGVAPLANPFVDPVGAFARHWRAMLAILLLGALASFAFAWLTPRRYVAAATVIVSVTPDSTGVVGRTVEGEALPMTEVLVAEVLSRSNLAQLISELGLYPELEGVMGTGEIVERMRAQVAIREQKRLSSRIENDANERVYSIEFEAPTQEAAVAVSNRLAQSMVDLGKARRLQRQERTIALLQSELARAKAESDARTEAVAKFRREKRGMLPSDLKASVARQRDLEKLRDKLVGVRAQQTARHPEVMALERQIAEHKRELAALDSRIASMRLVEEDLRALEAGAALAREEYIGLKRELQRAELGGSLLDAQPGDRMSVLNPAELPARSLGARRRYFALGLLASLLLALGCGALLELLQPVVVSAEDILDVTGQPALGWVARIR
jgi:uncharacterized protein involved in exopolysaccharide biosynthesis